MLDLDDRDTRDGQVRKEAPLVLLRGIKPRTPAEAEYQRLLIGVMEDLREVYELRLEHLEAAGTAEEIRVAGEHALQAVLVLLSEGRAGFDRLPRESQRALLEITPCTLPR